MSFFINSSEKVFASTQWSALSFALSPAEWPGGGGDDGPPGRLRTPNKASHGLSLNVLVIATESTKVRLISLPEIRGGQHPLSISRTPQLPCMCYRPSSTKARVRRNTVTNTRVTLSCQQHLEAPLRGLNSSLVSGGEHYPPPPFFEANRSQQVFTLHGLG